MRFSLVASALTLGAFLAVVAPAVAQTSEQHLPNPTSPNPYPHTTLTKRTICLLGFCLGGSSSNYLTDANNCGFAGNKCSNYFWLNAASGSPICSNGLCAPSACNWLWDFNWDTQQCQNVASDTQNCGKCGSVCSITGASNAACSSGTCIATACQSGYTLSSGQCSKTINTQSDVNNCGSAGNKCASSYSGGTGVSCVSGKCQATTCNNGAIWNPSSMSCQNCQSDVNNCGSPSNKCSFPNGIASCQSGSCVLTGCQSGFYNINGVCTSLDLTCDNNNCGSVNNKCTFTNGVGKCVNSQCTLQSCNTGYAVTTTGATWFSAGTQSCVSVNTQTDPNNCGYAGHICPNYPNSNGASCVSGSCQANCNAGYSWDSNYGFCRPVMNDVANCGACGKTCSVPNGVAACTNGQCTVGSCNTGYYNVNGVCTYLNTQTDVNNCGSQGNKCPSSFLGASGVSCVNGKCQAASCIGLTDWDFSAMICRDVSSDMNNCGKCGSVCSIPNGVGQCSVGKCGIQKCNSGFQNVNGVCVAMDCTSDLNNCGQPGNKCTFTNGQGKCSNSQCTYTNCDPNFALVSNKCTQVNTSSDPNNCGSVGNKCSSFANGGAPFCSNGKCQSKCNPSFDFDFIFGYCRDVSSDTNNCGACGNSCLSQSPGATSASCAGGVCYASACQTGYQLQSGKCTVVDMTTDPNHCGGWGQCCTFTPQGAQGKCVNSVCTVTSCPAGYTIQMNACVKSGPSQHARAKKSKIEAPKSLCPDHETACPIVGSASYAMAVNQHFSTLSDLGMLGSSGGYECLDTKQALDSCGGCASTGEGQDCTKIRGAVGVGCDEGKCVVFSCQAGWKPNMAGNKCVRAHGHGHNSSSSTDVASEDDQEDHAKAARRHLAARSHGHARHAHS